HRLRERFSCLKEAVVVAAGPDYAYQMKILGRTAAGRAMLVTCRLALVRSFGGSLWSYPRIIAREPFEREAGNCHKHFPASGDTGRGWSHRTTGTSSGLRARPSGRQGGQSC